MLLVFSFVFPIIVFAWQTSQLQIAFSNPNDPHDAAEQLCTNIQEYKCCAPIDLIVEGRGRTGFRAQRVVYTGIPPELYLLEVFRYDPDPSGSLCDSILAAAAGSGRRSKWSYRTVNPTPGLSGAWYHKVRHSDNETLDSPPLGVVWPNIIRYGGREYTDSERGDLYYTSPTGRVIHGTRITGTSNTIKGIRLRAICNVYSIGYGRVNITQSRPLIDSSK